MPKPIHPERTPLRRPPAATSEYHPARHRRRGFASFTSSPRSIVLPADANDVTLQIGEQRVQLTNLKKPFWKEPLLTKRHLLQYYADVSPTLLPHLRNRALVMKRYPDGIDGEFFYMKRAPEPRPDWLELCSVEHASQNVIDFVMVQDLFSLLWVVNLGCIDLHPFYATCEDVDRPDFLHFDLDPVEGTDFERVREVALVLRDTLETLKMPTFAKTSGSSGMHVYVPIVRGPLQHAVWTFAKEIAQTLAGAHPDLITAEYRVAKRPRGHVLIDYNQNAWGRTLASVYSVRPHRLAPVSTPVSWKEVERGFRIEDFRIDNVPTRLRAIGDLWAPLLARRGRFDLETVS